MLSLWGVRPAWLVAAVWALHPLNVASRSWVSEQKNTLSAALAVASCTAYTLSFLPGRPLAYYVALILLTLSLLAKAAFVPVPLILAVMIWWRFGRIPSRQWFRLIPMFSISLPSRHWRSGFRLATSLRSGTMRAQC